MPSSTEISSSIFLAIHTCFVLTYDVEQQFVLLQATTLGFGIAVSGGQDNPHFTSGDPAVVISDVVPNGPAWGLLQVNDRILSANGVSFESIDYSSAVDIIKNAEQINMIVKRRVAMPVMEFEQRTLKFTLTKSRKKDDFGIVLGCKFYIKEIRNPKLAEKEPGLREGDSVLRINGQSVEGSTLEEVSKWLERSRDKLCLVIQRDVRRGTSRWSSQNTVYERVGSVSATPRHSPSPMLPHQPLSQRSSHEYVNSPRWREGSLTDERRVSSPAVSSLGVMSSGQPVSSHFQTVQFPMVSSEYEYYNKSKPKPDQNGLRTVTFRKVGGSVGIRVIGGNEVGIFVSAVAADSPAALHGVCCGDRIVEVNGRSMRGVTRESAVQQLLALNDQVTLLLEHARQDFEHVRNSQLGDNFYIRSHFTKEKKSSPVELSVSDGDIFHVTDTLFGGTVGLWQASRVYSANVNKGEPLKGVIPNQSTAESIAREQRRFMESKSRGGTLLRRKLEARRTKSLPKNVLSDPAELSASVPPPAYERVALNTPSFHRPVILFGPLADVARSHLLSQFPTRFSEPSPSDYCGGGAAGSGGVIRLAAVDSVIASGKHCVLDISLESVERLQLAQYAPIVVLIDVDGRSRIREIRKKLNAPHVSSKKLAEQAALIKKHHAHLLSATVDATNEEAWFDALRDLVIHLQQRRLWMPEFPPCLPLEDVLLFPLSSKNANYDSDLESLKGDYSDYSTRREENAYRPSVPIQKGRSTCDWDNYNKPIINEGDGLSKDSLNPSELSHGYQQLNSMTISRRCNHHVEPPQPSGTEATKRDGYLSSPTNSTNRIMEKFERLNATDNDIISARTSSSASGEGQQVIVLPPNSHEQFNGNETIASRRHPNSPGYYHVKQLLNDESLYHDGRLANEFASARLREEARIRDDRMRGEQRLLYEKSQVPLQPPYPDMYSPREEKSTIPLNVFSNREPSMDNNNSPRKYPRASQANSKPLVAPKPHIYTDGLVKNRWPESATPESISCIESPSLASNVPVVTAQRQIGFSNGDSSANNNNHKHRQTLETSRCEETNDDRCLFKENNTDHYNEENAENSQEPTIVEETNAIIGSEGGVLNCPTSGVELRIPKGAIPSGETHDIYVKVCREGDSPPIDKSKGETLLSPLVMCGPQGLNFLTPCELRLPHCGPMEPDGQWSFSLKAGEGGEWQHMDVQPHKATDSSDKPFLSVLITHF
ncbi:PDZ/DHR/GLGF domain protein [Dictyocaulus viviparus]|uniref:PDZ/DHR/GLGF domain protein n=1 Tax=Dictyocaulus viviparus TaxID=29172 RepID=A0A0D8XUK1_DICVI|nr:PDZ/DHR/GLGF domain protein [Dictyocaulus viviparus]